MSVPSILIICCSEHTVVDGVRGVVNIHTLLLAGTEATLIEVETHHVLG